MGSTGYSEGPSENFLSEPCSYPDLESSQTSIELTFHTISQVNEIERERERERAGEGREREQEREGGRKRGAYVERLYMNAYKV